MYGKAADEWGLPPNSGSTLLADVGREHYYS
jgi:hypothetical protein